MYYSESTEKTKTNKSFSHKYLLMYNSAQSLCVVKKKNKTQVGNTQSRAWGYENRLKLVKTVFLKGKEGEGT